MTVMRRMLAALLLLGLTGLSAELVLLDHYEDLWQVIPLVDEDFRVVGAVRTFF